MSSQFFVQRQTDIHPDGTIYVRRTSDGVYVARRPSDARAGFITGAFNYTATDGDGPGNRTASEYAKYLPMETADGGVYRPDEAVEVMPTGAMAMSAPGAEAPAEAPAASEPANSIESPDGNQTATMVDGATGGLQVTLDDGSKVAINSEQGVTWGGHVGTRGYVATNVDISNVHGTDLTVGALQTTDTVTVAIVDEVSGKNAVCKFIADGYADDGSAVRGQFSMEARPLDGAITRTVYANGISVAQFTPNGWGTDVLQIQVVPSSGAISITTSANYFTATKVTVRVDRLV